MAGAGGSGASAHYPMDSAPAGSVPAGGAACSGYDCEASGSHGYTPPSYKNSTAVEYTGDSSVVAPWRSVVLYVAFIGALAAGPLML